MTLLKNALTSVAMLSGGLLVAAPQDADAQIRLQVGGSGYSNGYGNYGHNHGGHRHSTGYGYRNYDNYNNYNNYNYGTRYNGYGTRYNTYNQGHYDYHPTTVVPHGNHYDVVPGHYDYHYGH